MDVDHSVVKLLLSVSLSISGLDGAGVVCVSKLFFLRFTMK
jgi:hypothetical protein